MSEFSAILVPLSAALGLSLIVERVLELVQNLLERFLGKPEGRMVPKGQADKVLEEVEEAGKNRLRAEQLENETEPLATELLEARRALANAEDPKEKSELEARIDRLQEQLTEREADSAWDESVPTSVILVEPANDPDDTRTLKPFMI